MKICIIASQLLGNEKIGGFGSMSKQLALTLQEKGIEVVVLMPQRKGKGKKKNLNPFPIVFIYKEDLWNLDFFRAIDADIYHSQNQTILSSLARIAEPNKKHIVTCRDPRNWKDWINEFQHATWNRRRKIPFNYLTEESKLAYWAIQKADIVGVPAKFLIPKVQKMYGLKENPIFLPNIEDIPIEVPQKNSQPTLLWVGRMAKRKYPEHFIELAGHFPNVKFQLLGRTEETRRWQYLNDLAAQYANVEMLGYKDKFRDTDFFDYFDKAWILVNTSSREGLPLTFIEAAARGCAIVSASNPDNFASEFGAWAKDRKFVEGIRYLLEGDKWRKKGRLAHQYVYEQYKKEVAIEAHLNVYNQLLKYEFKT
ncbi:MAG: glycosyltransferase family 4 protein [Chitinophagales bacterium]